MVVTTGQVLKVEDWNAKKDAYLSYMRNQIIRSAYQRDLVLDDSEIVEIVEMRHNGKAWVSAKGSNVTHVKVVIERQAEHA